MDSDDEVRITLRLPKKVRDGIADAAAASGRSMNAEIVSRLGTSLQYDLRREDVLDVSKQEIDLAWEIRQLRHDLSVVRAGGLLSSDPDLEKE